MKREIIIPASVPIEIDKQPWSFVTALTSMVDRAPEFNTTGPGIRTSIRIIEAFKDKKAGERVELEELDWKLLREVFNTTSVLPGKIISDGQPVVIPGRTFIGYLNAVEEAKAAAKE
jgi:hypothetical protein